MRVRLTPSARLDLDEIAAYIFADNPQAAIETVIAVLDSIHLLAHHPDMGRPGRIAGTREYVIPGSPFIAAYRTSSGQIDVLRVLHGARQWPDRA